MPERDSKPDHCSAGAVLYQLSYHANWELVTLSVDYKAVDDGCRCIHISIYNVKPSP